MNPRKLWHLFLVMPGREKFFSAVLALVFVVSLTEYFAFRGMVTLSSGGEYFTEGFVGRFRSINPLFVDFNDADRDAAQLIFAGLIRFDPEEQNFFPDLALKFERSKNGLRYTFTLRENLTWHDGQPLSADDVVFTIRDIIQNPAFRNPILHDAFADAAVEKQDARTVVFNLSKANSYFITALTVGIVPRHLLADTLVSQLDGADFNENPIGSGPYKVDRVVLGEQGSYIDLSAFEGFHREKPVTKFLRLFAGISEDAIRKQLRGLNSVGKVASEGILSDELARAGWTKHEYVLNQFSALYFNTSQPHLKTAETRAALAMALDKDSLVLEGERRVDTIDLASSQDSAFAQNLDEAKKLLADQKWTAGSDGILLDNKGNRFTLKLLTLEKTSDEFLARLGEQWGRLGIELKIEKTPADFFTTLVSERRFDVLYIKQSLGYNRDLYPLLHSTQALTEDEQAASGLNFSNFRSFRTDGITEAMRKETVAKDKEKLLQELSRVLVLERPLVLLSTPVYSYWMRNSAAAFDLTTLDFHSDRLSAP